MHLKSLVAALTLALGFANVSPAQTADGAKTQQAAKRPGSGERRGTENLLARTVFQSLLGDFALQRGEISLGVDAWTDLAQRTRDPKVIARATDVAAFARQYDREGGTPDLETAEAVADEAYDAQ